MQVDIQSAVELSVDRHGAMNGQAVGKDKMLNLAGKLKFE